MPSTLCTVVRRVRSRSKYTPESRSAIPVKAGPWKFGGLPGIILKVFETNRLYTFEAVGIERGRHSIQQYEYKGYKKRTRAEVHKYQRTFTENWFKAVGWRSGTVDAGGHVILGEAVSIHTPYKPLELK